MYKNKTVSVVIPCLNEEEGVKNVLGRMPDFIDEVVVSNNGSTDKTVEVALSLGAKVVNESRRGYGVTYKTGILASSSDIVVTMDGDGSYPPEEISLLLEPIVNGAAGFVSGTRFPLKKGSYMSRISSVGNWGLTIAFNVLFFKWIKDSQSGMWVFYKSIYSGIEPESDGMAYSQEIKIRAIRAGHKFKEIPISYAPRIGDVKLNWLKDGIVNLLSLFKVQLWSFLKKKRK